MTHAASHASLAGPVKAAWHATATTKKPIDHCSFLVTRPKTDLRPGHTDGQTLHVSGFEENAAFSSTESVHAAHDGNHMIFDLATVLHIDADPKKDEANCHSCHSARTHLPPHLACTHNVCKCWLQVARQSTLLPASTACHGTAPLTVPTTGFSESAERTPLHAVLTAVTTGCQPLFVALLPNGHSVAHCKQLFSSD